MISPGDYAAHDGLGLADLVARKEVTAAELVEVALAAIENVNPRLNAVRQTLPAQAVAEIRGGLPTGPFTGVPFTPIFNTTGQPALSLPLHWSASGVPVGVQFAGRFGDEATLFRIASQLEQARPWAARRPAVHASS
jgi:Asp-tRNA(Asn)/Glu-tRNA(Gln) amidotransferase A subunit family amidase